MSLVELSIADAPELAALHARAFPAGQAWDEASFKRSLDQATHQAHGIKQDGRLGCFLLLQATLDQAEILTIATDPDFRRRGLAARLLGSLEPDLASQGISKWLLDVAEDNPGGIAFYQSLGFATDGRRPRYYKRLEGPRVDAILMSKLLGGQAIT